MSLSPGDRVDRYEVLDLLGAGGMGEVYRAWDPRLRRDVALKIVRAESRFEDEGGHRLLREARAAARLSHPNVVAVYDAGEVAVSDEAGTLTYIAMELVVGSSLRRYVGDEEIPIEQRVRWLADVGRALAAAHATGIVHRDVKPENVMVRDDGGVKVLDFGIARHTARAKGPRGEGESVTGDDLALGTPRYMSPEQLRGEAADERSDQFSLGVTAYELLAGESPWRAREAVHAVAEILLSTPPPLATLARGVPERVSKAVERALSKRPASRFPTMSALVDAIEGRAFEEPSAVLTPGVGHSPLATTETSPVTPTETAHTHTPRRLPAHDWSLRARWLLVLAGAAVLAMGAPSLLRRARPIAATSPPETRAEGECASSAECVHAHAGAAWRCASARHVCVAVGSTDCTAYAEPADLERDDLVWIGGMFPLGEGSTFLPEMRALDLARRDFAKALGSSAAQAESMRARPIAVALCDEDADPERAARHLVDDVEVPAVIGFRGEKSALATIPSVFLPRGVLSMLSIAQAPGLTKIPEPPGAPRLVWRSTLNNGDEDPPTSALLSEVLEPRFAKARGAGATRLAVVRSRGVPSVVDPSFRSIRFNGKGALENGDDFRQFVFDADAKSEAAIVALAAFAPDVVLDFSDAGFVETVLLPLEARWKGPQPRPVYLIGSSYARGVLDFIGKDAERRRRFFSVTNVSTTNNAELVLHYDLAHPDEPVTLTNAPQPSYDAFYLLAYAIQSIGQEAITGAGLARAIPRLLPPGTKVDVGPAGIFDAFTMLRAGGSIDLNGALGSLDFDPATGEAPVDYAILCCGVDASGRASGAIESGLVYDAKAGKLTGAMRCP